MTSALLAAVLLVCAAAATHDPGVAAVEALDSTGDDPEVDDDGDGDFAPFMIVLEHVDGWRCTGSLVSLRTALTSAWCARGRGAGAARELWALAARAAALAPASEEAVRARLHGARRVARVAVATGADAEMSDGSETAGESSWRGGAMDLALVELEEPFGIAAATRPILMATARGECGAGGAGGAQCHVSRALPRAPHRAAMRIVSADLAPPETCARAANYWTAVKDRALCLVGPELCPSDWGGGVVCGGKLCGVLSRSVRASGGGGSGGGGGGGGDGCGDTHAAQSVSLWRRFLHCAHTLRACGRGGDCADLCVERRLVEEPQTPAPATEAPCTEHEPSTAPVTTTRATTTPAVFYYPTRTSTRSTTRAHVTPRRARSKAPRKSTPASRTYAPMLAPGTPTTPLHTPAPDPPPEHKLLHQRVAGADEPVPLHSSFEFEPNRADFKASSSTRTSFKAGEYGDNAADYGGDEAPMPPTHTGAPSTPALLARTPAGPAHAPPAQRRAAPAAVRVPAKRAAPSQPALPLPVLILVNFVYVLMAV